MNSAQGYDDSMAFSHKVTQGETLASIAQRFHCKDGNEIYEYELNKEFRKTHPDPNSISPGDVLFIPSPKVKFGLTGKPHTSAFGVRLLIDGHMHIQSNNCAPMPVQWGVLKELIGAISRYTVNSHPKLDRKELAALIAKVMIDPHPAPIILGSLTGIALLPLMPKASIPAAVAVLCATANIMRFGKIGRLPSDLIGSLSVDKLMNTDLRPDDQWIIREPDENITQDEAGNRAELNTLNLKSSLAYKQFIEHTDYYFQGAKKWFMNCALTYDLTAAHYWGKFGIPVTIERSADDFCYINDFVTVGFGIENGVYLRHCFPSTVVPMSTANTRFLYAHALDRAAELSFPDQFHLGGQSLGIDGFPYLDFEENRGAGNSCLSLVNKKYIHLVDPLPGNEKTRMEHYHQKQLFLSEGAAAKHPLEILLFYHYDPRVHYGGSDAAKTARVETLAQAIIKDHAFFTYKFENSGGRSYGNSSIKNRIVLQPDGKLNSIAAWKNILAENQHSNQSVFDRLRQNKKSPTGIYWGIKMYPRLGYAPDDFATYPHLKELYKTCIADDKSCIASNVPLIAHCSDGGMSIADYFNYLRYDYNFVQDLYYPHDAALSFANLYAAPANWKRVLSEFPALKLCLAHFGGMDLWKAIGRFESIDKKFPAPPSGLPANDSKEKALARRYHNWIKPIAEMIQGTSTSTTGATFDNLYTDLAYFYIHEGYREELVDNLAFLLGKYPKLKERLLLGSDWYMVENTDYLLGSYSFHHAMFDVMRLLSKKVNYDTLHQFGVVNQLRFLGILDETGKEMMVEVEQLKEYVKRLSALVQTQGWTSVSNFSEKEPNEISSKASDLLMDLSNGPCIPKSDAIKSENRLLITCKGQNE
jgi:hypothetical protein